MARLSATVGTTRCRSKVTKRYSHGLSLIPRSPGPRTEGTNPMRRARRDQQYLQPRDSEEHHDPTTFRLSSIRASVTRLQKYGSDQQVSEDRRRGMEHRRAVPLFVGRPDPDSDIFQHTRAVGTGRIRWRTGFRAASLPPESELPLHQPDHAVHPESGGMGQPRARAMGHFGALLQRFPV